MTDPRERVQADILDAFSQDFEPDPYSVAESLVDEDVSEGLYEGGSTQLEMAFQTYETLAQEALGSTKEQS